MDTTGAEKNSAHPNAYTLSNNSITGYHWCWINFKYNFIIYIPLMSNNDTYGQDLSQVRRMNYLGKHSSGERDR